MSEETLDDVINGAPKEEPQPEVKAEEPKLETEEEPQPEPPKEEPKPSASSAEDVVKALTAELSRVRELNRELRKEPEKKEPTNIWEDPEKRLDELSQEFDSKLTKTRRSLSESYARRTLDDYDQKLDVFLGMVNNAPQPTAERLVAEMDASEDPAMFAYETAAKQMLIEKVGNVSDFEGSLRKQIEAEAEAKFKKLYEERLGQELPTSLADTRAAADNTSVVDETLDDVIGIDARHKR